MGCPGFRDAVFVGRPGRTGLLLFVYYCLSMPQSVQAGLPGDFDANHRVELADFERFQYCLVGPSNPPLKPRCTVADFDGDADIDLQDLGAFQTYFGRTEPCDGSWSSGFEYPGLGRSVFAYIEFNDGAGIALYAGGNFTTAGGKPAGRVARWRDGVWSAVGMGMDSNVTSFAVFDDGTGAALYAGGVFRHANGKPANRLARWNGASWSEVGGGLDGPVAALIVFDDGTGSALYIGGRFQKAGTQVAHNIAKWDGLAWTPLGDGTNGLVDSLVVYDDGGGAALYAGGDFLQAGGITVNHVARWDGKSWTSLSDGIETNSYNPIHSMAVFDDGTGPTLYVAGDFYVPGDQPMWSIAAWDGETWTSLDGGVAGGVDALSVHDDGTGVALYAGGTFFTFGPQGGQNLARWDGTSWIGVGGGTDELIYALASHDDGAGPALYAGGFFQRAGEVKSPFAAKWNGSTWSSMDQGAVINNEVRALTVFDDGSGPKLHGGGSFGSPDGPKGVGRLSDGAWHSLGSGIEGTVNALASWSFVGAPRLVAGGSFPAVGETTVNHVAQWDGLAWSAMEGGVSGYDSFASVHALASFDDGRGPALFVGGHFVAAGSVNAYHIARWDGQTWSALGGGTGHTVYSLVVFDDGSGPALYAGGSFTFAGGTVPYLDGMRVNHVARWDGTQWSALGSGLRFDGPSPTFIYALAVFDDGHGPALYATGRFDRAGDEVIDRIAKWDGKSWTALAGGFSSSQAFPEPFALATFDDGTGISLYVGGSFTNVEGVAANHIVRWDGISWYSLDSGMNDVVKALQPFDDGVRRSLFAGGLFTTAGDKSSGFVAEWRRPLPPCSE